MNKIRIASEVLTVLACGTLAWSLYLWLVAFRSPAWLLLPAVLGATAVRGWWILHSLAGVQKRLDAP
jgi:hypothetical protein